MLALCVLVCAQSVSAQPQSVTKDLTLPECDSTKLDLLDLATGRIVYSETAKGTMDLEHPVAGDIYFDEMYGLYWLGSIGATSFKVLDTGLSDEYMSKIIQVNMPEDWKKRYCLIPCIPCKIEVRSRDGTVYLLNIQRIVANKLELRYKKRELSNKEN